MAMNNTKSNKNTYPTFIKENGKIFLVYVPDLDIYTEGKSLTDAIEMARGAIGLKGITLEDDGVDVPPPSSPEVALKKAQNEADDIFDYSTGLLTFVDVNFTEYRLKHDNKMVRRNVTLPCWMNYQAEKAHLNVSKVLQDALEKQLQRL
jgi:predicted RNase H-like HicB family nuclease